MSLSKTSGGLHFMSPVAEKSHPNRTVTVVFHGRGPTTPNDDHHEHLEP